VTVVVLLLCSGVNVTGTALGAVYNPPELIVPVLDAPPVTPLTCHVTAVLGDPSTRAENCAFPKTRTLALLGVMLIEVLAAVTVTLAEAVFVGSADDTAVTVTVAGFGNCTGAVYSPLPEVVPTLGFPPTTEFTCQVTADEVASATVAVNCTDWRSATLADVGVMVTDIGAGGLEGPPDTPWQAARNIEAQRRKSSPSRRCMETFLGWEPEIIQRKRDTQSAKSPNALPA
jgi:hypothetical protein